MTSSNRSMGKLALIALLFLTPFFAAVVMRFGGWEPPNTRNIGELLAPPLSMEAVGARLDDPGGTLRTWENTDRHWTLLLQLPKRCEAECRDAAMRLTSVRQALGRHIEKLHPFELISDGGANIELFPSIRLDGPIPSPLAEQPAALPQVWLVDPHGYLVMRYREGFDPNGLRRDLSRLIK